MFASKLQDAVLASERFWNATFVEEGTMEFDLPGASASESAAAPAGSPINETTDGELLSQQALHSIVRDMITRTGGSGTNGTGFFPKCALTCRPIRCLGLTHLLSYCSTSSPMLSHTYLLDY